jgi:epoxyqueuosine reductase
MTDALREWAKDRGYLVAWGPLTVLETVRAELERRRETGEIDPVFARENLAFDDERESLRGGFRRVLVVVMPRPAHLVTFVAQGRRLDAVLPPTYQRYLPTFEDVRQALAAGPLAGAEVKGINVPLKSLASRLGLVQYGRNNLTYAPSFGSYLQLLAYATDADLPIEPGWRASEPRVLEDCATCRACQALCPTGAVRDDRFLLRAERCLTLANETSGPWPSWVPPAAHHCLLGCLRCQRFCPANPELPCTRTGIEFDEVETSALLEGDRHDGVVWERIRLKLGLLGQSYQEDVVGRNLRAVLGTLEQAPQVE